MQKHHARLVALATRLLAWDRQLGEDAVQDVWVAVWKHRRRFRGEHGEASLNRFLNVSTVNRCRSLGRSLTRRRKREARRARAPDAAAPATAGRHLQQDETTRILRHAMQALSPSDRHVLVLHHLEAWAIDAVAESLGITANACRVRLSRARTRLKQHLPPHLAEDLP